MINYYEHTSKLEANLFSLLFCSRHGVGFTHEDMSKIEDILWQCQKENPSVSFLVCRIDKDFERKVRKPYTTEYQLLRGDRPAYVYILMIGDSKKSAYTSALKVKKLILDQMETGRYGFYCRGKEDDAKDIINWCLCLSDYFKTVGKFNFFPYKNEEVWLHYLTYLEPSLV